MSMLKGSIKSKTIWFAGALAIASAVQANLTSLQAAIPPTYYGVIGFAVAVAVAGLRFVTTESLHEKGTEEQP